MARQPGAAGRLSARQRARLLQVAVAQLGLARAHRHRAAAQPHLLRRVGHVQRIVGGSGAAANNLLTLNLKPNVVYRITALAYGRKGNTMAVLQQTYARQFVKD